MKINNISRGRIRELDDRKDVQPCEAKESKSEGGGVKKAEDGISRLGRIVSRAKIEAERVEEVRGDKVARARERLESGYYDKEEVKEEIASRLADRLKELKDF
jgi:hypothetical protein